MGAASHYPAKLTRFVVRCGPGPGSKRPFTDWRVLVVANIRGDKPGWIMQRPVSDGIVRPHDGHDDGVGLQDD